MQCSYGYIPDTVGSDNEDIDVYLGSNVRSRKVYVVNQLDPSTGMFDEEKVMLGFDDPAIAESMYRVHYPDNGYGFFGGMTPMTMEEFLKEYIYRTGRDPWKPPLHTKQYVASVEADHGPGDADGCGGTDKPDAPVDAPVAPEPKKKPGKGPAKPKKAPAEKPAPVAKPATVPGKVKLPVALDTNEVKSPAQKLWQRSPGHGKSFYDRAMGLLGGPGFNPYAALETITANMAAGLEEYTIEAGAYDTPLSGPLGDPDALPESIVRSGA
jgi:hypothetical protein